MTTYKIAGWTIGEGMKIINNITEKLIDDRDFHFIQYPLAAGKGGHDKCHGHPVRRGDGLSNIVDLYFAAPPHTDTENRKILNCPANSPEHV